MPVPFLDISRAAETLGITRVRLYRKISQFDLKDAVEEGSEQLACPECH